MKPISELIKEKPWLGWVIFSITIIIVFLLGLLFASISERRAEAIFTYAPKVNIPQTESRNKIWGINYPREYGSYLKSSDEEEDEEGEEGESRDMLAADPKLVLLWAGYSFSKEYNKPRTHHFAIEDIRNILRTGAPKNDNDGPAPATCWSCKSPDVPRLMEQKGIAEFYKGKWAAKGSQVVNPIGCADCHDSKTMNLKITRPALLEALNRQKININEASFQEMRSLVCAQCHVEYYFTKGTNYLNFPWDKGTKVEDVEKYYDEINFSDWTHELSRTPMLKAQHPDYEIFKTGIHAQRGLSCSDCHLPYYNEGGQKFTNHFVQNPLNNISKTCQVCHRQDEKTLKANVEDRKQSIKEIRDKVEEQLVKAHLEAKVAWDSGADATEMKEVLLLIRHSQWRWDYAAASHGAAFHSPIETSRILASALDRAQEARILLTQILISHKVKLPISYPDISNKEKAQKYIGIDLAKLKAEKKEFIEKVLPQWDKQSIERENRQ